ncbi:MAG: hypothetical protein HFF39_06165 [Lawsonibacter sp.]|nr:hypothetical protein [Lawsonibacter sp.]
MNGPRTAEPLRQKLARARAEDRALDRAHRQACGIMAAWAAIVALDRLIGLACRAYGPEQLPFALAGGFALVLAAFLGTRGHIQGAMMLMELNMAVFLLQFTATCFFYRERTVLWSTLFYGLAAGVLLAGSLALFLNRNLERYRAEIRRLKGRKERGPLFYRTGSRLVRSRK